MRMSKLLAPALLLFASSAFAEPSIDEVYRAASGGHIDQAQTMMQEVLKAHPDSAKAHFVEAELLAQQRDISGARAELARATAINPSLSFARPDAVAALKRKLGESAGAASYGGAAPQAAAAGSLPSWIWPVGLAMVVAFLIWAVRSRRPRYNGGGYPAAMPPQSPYGSPYGPGGVAPPSTGSGLLGSLATGAAIGGGIVAGEALAHRLLDSDEPHRYREPDPSYDNPPADNGMGGNDFGIGDSGSWDDSDSGGGGW